MTRSSVAINSRNGEELGRHLDQVVFVVSTGRTGTMSLAKHFDSVYPEVTAVHEPTPSWRFRVLSNMHICGRVRTEQVAALLYMARYQHLKRVATGTYMEVNPFLSGSVAALDQVFDGPLVVHLVRHPMAVVRSLINNGAFAGLKGVTRKIIPYWTLNPRNYRETVDVEIPSSIPEEYIAWRWSVVNEEIERQGQCLGDRLIRLRYEDLFDSNNSGICRLVNRLGLVSGERRGTFTKIAVTNRGKYCMAPPFHSWSRSLQSRVERLVGQQMERYGYPSMDPDQERA